MAEQAYNDVVNDSNIYTSTAFERVRTLLDSIVPAGLSALFDGLRRRSMSVSMFVPSTTASSSADANIYKVPFPCKLRFVDMSITNANSAATVTGDILVKRGGGSYTSVLNAAESIITAINSPARVAPETTSDYITLAKDDLIKFTVAAGSGGNPANACAVLYLELI